jgi:ribosomal protein S14
LQKLAAGRLLGRFFAASRARLREVAERLGVHHLANLGDCAAR